MASLNYNSFAYDIAQGNVSLGADTFKAMLVTAAYVPNKDTHNRRDDVINEVANGNGYTTGGNTATLVVTQDNVNDRIQVAVTVASWPASSITTRGEC